MDVLIISMMKQQKNVGTLLHTSLCSRSDTAGPAATRSQRPHSSDLGVGLGLTWGLPPSATSMLTWTTSSSISMPPPSRPVKGHLVGQRSTAAAAGEAHALMSGFGVLGRANRPRSGSRGKHAGCAAASRGSPEGRGGSTDVGARRGRSRARKSDKRSSSARHSNLNFSKAFRHRLPALPLA